MMKLLISIIVAGLLCAVPLIAKAGVNVFACEPEWASLVEEIGGDLVKVKSATHAKQDPHYIRARPSLVAAIRKADLLICSGAGLEVGWLPILMQKASSGIQPGFNGYLMASEFVQILGKHQHVDRSMGDVHPEGNPHVHLNPHNVALVARELTQRLSIIDSKNASSYDSGYRNFSLRWQKAIVKWESEAAVLTGQILVTHHKSFTYLMDWLGIREAATLEPKPGIPPTSSHLEVLLRQLRKAPAAAIIRTPYDSDNASEWLAEKIGIKAIILPFTVGGDEKSTNLFELFNQSIALLKEATHGHQH